MLLLRKLKNTFITLPSIALAFLPLKFKRDSYDVIKTTNAKENVHIFFLKTS